MTAGLNRDSLAAATMKSSYSGGITAPAVFASPGVHAAPAVVFPSEPPPRNIPITTMKAIRPAIALSAINVTTTRIFFVVFCAVASSLTACPPFFDALSRGRNILHFDRYMRLLYSFYMKPFLSLFCFYSLFFCAVFYECILYNVTYNCWYLEYCSF